MPTSAVTPHDALAHLVSPAGRSDPYPTYDTLRSHGDIVAVDSGVYAAVGYHACQQALRSQDLHVQDQHWYDAEFPQWRSHSSLQGFTDSMLYTNPPDHARMRRLVAGAFTARRIRALRPAVQTLTNRLVDELAELDESTPVDFMANFAYRLPVAVICELLGVPEHDQLWFRDVSARVTVALEGTTNPDHLRTADAAMDELSDYFADLIGDVRRHGSDDLIGALVSARDGASRLSESELIGNLVLLLVAGFDTTTHLLGHGLQFALTHPVAAESVRRNDSAAEPFVEETLRLEPPVQATTRWARSDVELAGTHVPAGSKVLVMLAAGNRDPQRYAEPATFDITRRAVQPLSFGGGMHLCLGAVLARLEGQVALPAVLRRFPRIKAAAAPQYRDRWLVRGHRQFPVVLG